MNIIELNHNETSVVAGACGDHLQNALNSLNDSTQNKILFSLFAVYAIYDVMLVPEQAGAILITAGAGFVVLTVCYCLFTPRHRKQQNK